MKSGVFEQMEGGFLRLVEETASLLEAVKKASELNSSALDSTFVGRLYCEEAHGIIRLFPSEENR